MNESQALPSASAFDMHRFLFLGFLISTLISISLMDFFLTLMTVIFVLQWFKDPSVQSEVKTVLPYFVTFGAFVAVVVVGFAVNSGPGAPVGLELLKLRWGLYPLSVFYFLNRISWRDRDVKVYLGVLIGVGIFCVVQHFTGWELGRQPDPRWWIVDGFRVSGFLGSPILFAHCVALPLSFLFALVLNPQMLGRYRFLVWTATGLLSLSLLYTFTRGAWMAVVAAMLFQAFCLHWKKGLLVLFVAVAVATAASLGVPYVKNRIQSVVDYKDKSNADRILLWQTNWDIFKEYPLFGVGMDENQRRVVEFHRKYDRPTGMEGHAHNQYLQILAGTGALGFLSFFLFVLQFFVASFQSFRRSATQTLDRALALGAMGALIVFMVGALTEANLERAAFRNSFVLVLGVILYLRQKTRPKPRAS